MYVLAVLLSQERGECPRFRTDSVALQGYVIYDWFINKTKKPQTWHYTISSMLCVRHDYSSRGMASTERKS